MRHCQVNFLHSTQCSYVSKAYNFYKIYHVYKPTFSYIMFMVRCWKQCGPFTGHYCYEQTSHKVEHFFPLRTAIDELEL